MNIKYRPLGSKVLLKVLPIESKTAIAIPEHLKGIAGTGSQQFFKVEALGPAAVEESYPLEVGQRVMISSHPSLLVGVDAVESLMVTNNKDIAVICEEEALELGQN